jgi:hypothetical protein
MKTLKHNCLSFQGLLARGEAIRCNPLTRKGLHIYRGGLLGGHNRSRIAVLITTRRRTRYSSPFGSIEGDILKNSSEENRKKDGDGNVTGIVVG